MAQQVLRQNFEGGRLWVEDVYGTRHEVQLDVEPEELVALPPPAHLKACLISAC